MITDAGTSPFKPFFSPLRDKPFLIVLFFFLASYWFFSYWVLKNHGIIWAPPSNMNHHPFNMSLLDTNFIESVTYLFSQNPFYSIVTWLMIKTQPARGGFAGFIILHYLLGFFALISLYKILDEVFCVSRPLIIIALVGFFFNPGTYRAFSSGWYDFPTMCLVSILAFSFARLVYHYSRLNLFWFITLLLVLTLYRNSFHPLAFLVPTVILLMLGLKHDWKYILACSLLPVLVAIAPMIKNYMLLGVFQSGINSLALNFKTVSFEFQNKNEIMSNVSAGVLSPVAICYSHILDEGPVKFQGQLYTNENCNTTVLQSFAQPRVDAILKARPYLANPQILSNQYNYIDNSHIPNSLTGLVIASQLIKDSQSYLITHPGYYWKHVFLNTASQMFRSTQVHEFLIANKDRQYPDWFGSRLFDLDFFKINRPDRNQDAAFRPVILMGILCPLVYALLFAAGLRRKNLYSTTHFSGLLILLSPMLIGTHLFPHLYSRFLLPSLVWTLLFMIPGLILTMKNLFTSTFDDRESRKKLLLTFIAWLCIYVMGVHLLIAGSELERYRFSIDGLLVMLFLFWVNSLYLAARRARQNHL